jgi:aminoglycoside phosphotransferase (APT) family kinase protein
VPDWRLGHLPDIYSSFISKKEILIEEGLSSDEIDRLITLVPVIKSICDSISKHEIKETLVNCDFNENNMIMDEAAGVISLIDWGESVITHPFLSLASHIRNTERRYPLASKEGAMESIKKKCLSCWSDFTGENELEEIYKKIERLLPIFTSLSLYRLQVSTNNKSKAMQRWFIKDFLRTLIRNEIG